MPRAYRTAIAGILVALTTASSSLAQSTSRMDQVIQYYAGEKLFMGSVLIIKDGNTLLDKSWGLANVEWNIPATPDTKYRLGSLTKQFTAAAILLLVDRGQIKLDAPVKQYLPEAPSSWDGINVSNLLNHTAGIPNYAGQSDLRRLSVTPLELVARFKDKPLEFSPGQDWNYSNSNYVVLGTIIEKVTGLSYGEFIQQNIFNRLGMTASGYDVSETIIPMRASGYIRKHGEVVNADFIDMSTPYAAGSLYSTTHDLLRWEAALYEGSLLRPASLEAMTTPFKQEYAFGLTVHDDGGHLRYSHNGGINGFSTALAWYPKDHLAIAVLDNVENGDANQVMLHLADVALNRATLLPNEHKDISLSERVLERHVGQYQLPHGPVVSVSRDGDHLYIQFNKETRHQLISEAENSFFLQNIEAGIFFPSDIGNKSKSLIFRRGGLDRLAARLQ